MTFPCSCDVTGASYQPVRDGHFILDTVSLWTHLKQCDLRLSQRVQSHCSCFTIYGEENGKVLLRVKFVVIFIGLSVDYCYFDRSSVLTYTSVTLDHYGSGGWGPPTPSSGPRWGPIPGSSSSTPGPPPIMDSPYRITCPVHSPYRLRFTNGGLDYYSHQVGTSRGASKTSGLSDESVSLGR
jgi:hypothetical protein